MENKRKAFEDRLLQLMNRYPYALENKSRFYELINDGTFIKENVEIYNTAAGAWFLEPYREKANYDVFLNEFERFIEKWKTPPLNSWLFRDDKAGLKERLEKIFDLAGRSESIKVYPWTTKKEIKIKLDVIRKQQTNFKLKSELYRINFSIRALRNANWSFSEIIDFIRRKISNDTQIEKQIEDRDRELRQQGKTEDEIDKILDNEFPNEQFDDLIDLELDYDAIRKRKESADELCDKILSNFSENK